MNRHHPYGAGFDGPRRGGASPSAGPDRSHRAPPFRGRGGYNTRGRGGGGYSSYDSANMSNPYDQSNQSQPYADYDLQPPPTSYYQPPTSTYGDSSHYNATPGYEAYDKYEDAPAQDYDTDFNRRPRQPRKDRDDKVHDSIIEERIQRERPCRTLFIRNIKYETSSDDVRALFEEHGEIKTFFDLISTRGMVFVTYYDLRAAERARERLQGSEISGRPIDVHYSLPRDDQRGGEREKNQQFQGTLQVTLRNSVSGSAIDDGEVRRKLQQFGDVKSIRSVADRIDSRYVEFYDTRACDEAFDRLRHQGLQDGVMDIVFAWDNSEGANTYNGANAGSRESGGGGGHRNWDEPRDRGHRGGRSRGGRGRGRGGNRNTEEDFDRQGNNDYNRGRRFDDDYGRGGGRGGGGGGGASGGGGPPAGYSDRYNDSSRSSYNGPPAPYAPPVPAGPAPLPYGMPQLPPAAPPQGPPDDRLDQARKVQQLLAALKQPQNGQSGNATPPSSMSPLGSVMPPAAPSMSSSPYYSQPPQGSMPPYPGAAMPPPATYTGIPPPAPSPPLSSGPGLTGLPPNIMALLQQAQQQRPPSAPYGMPPPPSGPPAQYQQLMSYLAQAQGPK